MRIRKPGLKVLYIAIYLAIQVVFSGANGLVTLVPRDIGLIVGPLLLLVAVAIGVRTFRGAGEDVAAPRSWWRMSTRPAAGFVLASVFVVGLALDGFAAAQALTPTLPLTLEIVSGVALTALYVQSSVRLVRMGRRARASATATATDAEIDSIPGITDAPTAQATGSLAVLAITVAGALVVVGLGAGAGLASHSLAPIVVRAISAANAAHSANYRTVKASSPLYTSTSHDFSIRFPATPGLHTYSNGDIDVSSRNGTSDYSIIAGTLDAPIPAAEIHDFYVRLLDGLKVKGATRLSLSKSSIDGVQSEMATFHTTNSPSPWNYSIVVCGKLVFQLNTYGVSPADTKKFADSMVLKDKTTDACE
jgi:hypothetical protein